jgi:hypothetical protein
MKKKTDPADSDLPAQEHDWLREKAADLPPPPPRAARATTSAAAELAEARAQVYRTAGDSARATALDAFAEELRAAGR